MTNNFSGLRQDLIYRVVKLYFETLQASDEIDLLQAQRKEILAQLAEAEAMFKAGLVSITDVNETKTKAALIEVEQLNAVQLFKIKKREFETVTGSLPGKLNKLNPVITFTEVENKAEEWIDIAIENNLDLQIRRDEVKIADREIDIRQVIGSQQSMHLLRVQEIGIVEGILMAQLKTKGVKIFLMRLALKLIFPFMKVDLEAQGYVKASYLNSNYKKMKNI